MLRDLSELLTVLAGSHKPRPARGLWLIALRAAAARRHAASSAWPGYVANAMDCLAAAGYLMRAIAS